MLFNELKPIPGMKYFKTFKDAFYLKKAVYCVYIKRNFEIF